MRIPANKNPSQNIFQLIHLELDFLEFRQELYDLDTAENNLLTC